MRVIFKIILMGILGLLSFSCEPKKLTTLSKSEFLTDSIYSNNLNEYRKHNLYLPMGFDKEKEYPIVFATDGNSSITNKKIVLDSLIDNKIIKPLIFVASFSNNKLADNTKYNQENRKENRFFYGPLMDLGLD